MYMNEQQFTAKISKARIVDSIRQGVEITYKVPVSKIEYIDETPETIRHSCPMTGIAILNREISNVMIGNAYLEIPYYFCPVCGKLYIYKNFE